MKIVIAALLCVALAPCAVFGAVSMKLVSDSKEVLAGTPYMGHVELWSDDGGTTECACRLMVYDPCTVYAVTKPSGLVITISDETVSLSKHWMHQANFTIPARQRVMSPVCIGLKDGEVIFDENGKYVVSIQVACGNGAPAVTASDTVVVVRRGRGYENFVAYLLERGGQLYRPCLWSVLGAAEMEGAKTTLLGKDSEYAEVLDALFAYQVGRDTIREVVRVGVGRADSSGLRNPGRAEQELRLGLEASLRAGVNRAFWENCRALYEWNVKRGVKYDESEMDAIWRIF